MKAKDITLGGIMIALTLIVLYSTSIIPISTLSVLTVASCLIPICIIRSNVKSAIFVYIISTILSFFFIPITLSIYYGLFFGLYGIVKYYIERLQKISLEVAIKLIFFNLIFVIAFFILSNLIGSVATKLPLWILWIIAQPVFLIFDYALTLIISSYISRIHKHIK